MKKTASIYILVTATVLGQGAITHGESILDSKHNLSISGQYNIHASTESRVCVFCHTPHNARQDIPYLWNRSAQTTTYTPYASSTLSATVGQPTGASKLCLSCHDGTIALGAVLSEPTPISFIGASTLSGLNTSLETDLSDDHPVSFSYQSSIDSGNLELVAAAALASSPVQLDSTGQLQCTACHDPHDNAWGKFLVMTNQASALCIECHNKSGWTNSTHATSTATWNKNGTNPWPNSNYLTVADNACGNCHRPHTAGRHQRLLKQINEEDNCLVCHSGQVATESNIAVDLSKFYRHPVADYLDVHDATEDFTFSGGVTKHVECEDCHNPHQVNSSTAVAPYVSGKNIGVQGIDAAGTKTTNAQNLYEICFKCHAAALNNVITTPEITRQIFQVDTRLEFSPGNPSSHPVEAASTSEPIPSLLAPYTSSSIIYCTDCHGSDNATAGANGPHGSINKHLLVANYATQDGTATTDTYALCFKCHNQNAYISQGGSTNFPQHYKHIVQENTSCATCHDSHGISATQGTSSKNSKLINFNINVVSPYNGELYYNYDATRPTCVLICHGHIHAPKGYDR
ncbi:MAG: cytochrome c3 family protein [Desulfocapsaceae bacterium]|nr:cytochrome c3 family protein [Desulfocapsaceae bacterium]